MKTNQYFDTNKKYLFLIDGVGALLTAFMLGAVLTNFEEYFGMPQNILYYLSGIALIFSIYSLSCFAFNFKNLKLLLKIIIFANLFYCFLSAALVFFLFDKLTTLGIIYFVLELIVIIVLVIFEFIAYSK